MGKDLRKTKSYGGEGPQKKQKIMGETQEKKRKIEKTPEGSIKQKKKIDEDSGMEPPGVEYEKDSGMEQVFILPEWSK